MFGKHLVLDLKNCNHKKMITTSSMRQFVIDLCFLIDMNRFEETLIRRLGKGKLEGYSLFQFIETSNITIHFEEIKNQVFIDLFSCKDFNENSVINFSKNYFEGEILESRVFKRGL